MNIDFFLELYGTLPKNGPGSSQSSLRALKSIKNHNSIKTILDVGCGSGRQTIFLAKNTRAKITALDSKDFQIKLLKKNIKAEGFEGRIEPVQGSMDDLSFLTQKQDLIWAEGSIYNIGFEKGLKYFKDFLKDGGCIGVSDAVWLKDKKPKEIEDFWVSMYPGMTDINGNIQIIKKCGCTLLNHFTMPSSDWREGFYDILSQRVDEYYAKGVDNNIKSALFGATQGEILARARREIDMFENYNEYYGYEFFILQK